MKIFLAMLLVPSLALADGFKVDAIKLSIFDRAKNKIAPFEKPPDPYGMDMDLLVAVKLKGPSEAQKEEKLALTVSAPAHSDEATGDHAPWKLELSQPVRRVHESGASWFLFVVPWECRPKVTFTAKIMNSEKSITKPVSCAE